MPIWDHLEELRERVLVAALASGVAILTCFVFAKDLVVFLEGPAVGQGVRFLQLSPGEFFFTTLKVIFMLKHIAVGTFESPVVCGRKLPGFTWLDLHKFSQFMMRRKCTIFIHTPICTLAEKNVFALNTNKVHYQ